LTGLDRTQVGRSLVSHFLERWENAEALLILLRSSATNADAARRMLQVFGTQLQPLVAVLAPPGQSRWRSGLIATQILGLAWCRFVLRLPPVVEMTRDEIVDWVGPTIQYYLGLPPAPVEEALISAQSDAPVAFQAGSQTFDIGDLA
jgi:tetracycline repressor-like protein